MKRNYGADIFRILCCIGVLFYHVMDDIAGQGGIAKALYYSAAYCVPGFFLLSGFLMAEKSNTDIKYYEKKAVSTFFTLFMWIIFWCIVHLVRTGEFYDVLDQLKQSAFQGGILPVAWFIYTYIVIVAVVAYPLVCLKVKNKISIVIIAVLWIVALGLGVGKNIVETKGQVMWLHLYVGYFILGMAVSVIKDTVQKTDRRVRLAIEAAILVGVYVLYMEKVRTTELMPHQHYGTFYYTVWILTLLMLCLEIKINSEKLCSVVLASSKNTMVVYLGHLPILLYITERHPIQNVLMALLMIGGLFIGLTLIAEPLKRLPTLRKLV